MKSKYPGRCPKCGIRFITGQTEITKRNGQWVHEVCPDRMSGRTYRALNEQPEVRDDTWERNRPVQVIDTDALSSLIDNLPDEVKPIEKSFTPSKYQQAIFDFILNGQGHAVVEAVAGSGKTTTIVKALDLTPKDSKVAFVAFNRHIAKELEKRSPAHVRVSTLHKLGLDNIKKYNPHVKVDDKGEKMDAILNIIYPVSKKDI